MTKKQFGFTAIEAAVILLVVIVIGAVGYKVHQDRTAKSNSPAVTSNSKQAATSASVGTTQSINSLLTTQGESEANLYTQDSTSDQSTASSANTATANLGGAYNESTF